MNRSRLFAIAFILAAFSVTLWMFQSVPHPVTLHINDNWHVMLIGEEDVQNIKFSQQEIWLQKQDTANLWLEGMGTIDWKTHHIKVAKNQLRFNQQLIERSNDRLEVHLMFYPDGRVTKGKATLKSRE